METALQALGFAAAGETAYGAEMIGHAHRQYVDGHPERWPVITSSLSGHRQPHRALLSRSAAYLAPLVSPMVAHGRILRGRYGHDAMVVFIGPCIAKKQEMREQAVADAVDAALTFAELAEWLAEDEVTLPADEPTPPVAERANARLFPVEGGLVGTAKMDTDILTSRIVTTSAMPPAPTCCAASARQLSPACGAMACEGG